MIFALALRDREIVDAGDTPTHQTVVIEFPVFVAVATKPAAAVVVPFAGEARRDPVLMEAPDLLDQSVIEFSPPFARSRKPG